MQHQAKTASPDRHLSLHEVVQDLVASGRLAKEEADQFLIPARNSKLDIHPLVMLAQQE
ncbi:MAG: hypothetical protein HKM94_04565, partial [Halobacteria archaeon]|nr:hypothetical protein [Halobacteria archaeon]